MLDTPILFIIFNRLETTKLVFDQIRNIQPKYLYIAADGPRSIKMNEKNLCNEVRDYVLSLIDWPCKLKTLFRNTNLGCGKAVSSAITWFFSEVEQGIILEDDCLPSESFFTYCENLLEKYKDNPKVMHIAGHNPLGKTNIPASYYFASIQHCWGWASWRRAWKYYEFDLKSAECSYRENKYFGKKEARIYWGNVFNKMISHTIDTWDYQWTYTVLRNNGICINPTLNMISNIGFGSGVHFSEVELPIAKRYTISEIKHPSKIKINYRFVKMIDAIEYGIKRRNILKSIIRFIKLNRLSRKLKTMIKRKK